MRDGEGATKFITVAVEGGHDREGNRRLRHPGLAAGQDRVRHLRPQSRPHPRAIDCARIDALDVDKVRVWQQQRGGSAGGPENGGRAASYQEEDGARIMQADEITIRVDLGRGSAKAKVYTCDFSYDYVKINADYRVGCASGLFRSVPKTRGRACEKMILLRNRSTG